MHALLLCIGLTVGVEQHTLSPTAPSAPKSVIVKREIIVAPVELYSCSPPAPQGYEFETHRCMAQTTAGYVQLFGM
ncbi:MAG: hypothetical protein U0805_11695 [Pirellulales bacterium]